MDLLVKEIKKCTICLPYLVDGVNPVLSVKENSKIAIVGQAPGRIVHQTGVPWDDKSRERLRDWLGVSAEQFYGANLFAIIPMGFCYPGKAKSSDLPPRRECAPKWHVPLFEKLDNLKLTLLIGQYSQKYYLQNKMRKNLTETVKNFSEYLPQYFPLPHPSPRNNIWLKKNHWFEKDLIFKLREIIESNIQRTR